MTICIVTIIDNVNIGTYLQAYALANVLEELGHQPFFLDYSRPSRDSFRMFLRSFHKIPIKRWPGYWYWLTKRASTVRRHRIIIKKYLTPKHYLGYNSVCSNPPFADLYITGSDHVWNSAYNEGIDKTFYLGFAPNDARRISYASSIGMPSIPENERREMLCLLSKYDAISVRETSAIELLEDLGLERKKLSLVLDPTLLLSKEQWNGISKTIDVGCPFLLIYGVENDKIEDLENVASFIAAEKGLKIVHVSHGDKTTINCYRHYKNADPMTFLSLFANADFTVVSSFHGTAFSVNFRKDFVTIMPNQFGSRVNSLLEICGLESRRYFSRNDDLASYLSAVDYSKAEVSLAKLRGESIAFLKNGCKK